MPTLYKFIGKSDDVRFLLQGCVKFTSIPELNDPSELLPNVVPQDVRASLQRLRQKGYSDEDMVHLRHQEKLLQRLAPRSLAIPAPKTKEAATRIIRSAFYDDLPLLQHRLEETAETISSKVGIFCLTKRNDSLPMWAHYAQNATGLVVGFRELCDIFRGDDTGILYRPISVRYERERLGVTFDPRTHESLFFAKFQDWSYEQEVRVVLPLADCRQAMNGGRQLHLFDIAPRQIAQVILGWRMTALDVDNVTSLVRCINPSVEVIQARIEKGQARPGDRLYP
jgi:hypothetical protein